jgi:hypothetical protein
MKMTNDEKSVRLAFSLIENPTFYKKYFRNGMGS